MHRSAARAAVNPAPPPCVSSDMNWIETIFGAAFWTLANLAYLLFRTNGEHGFRRIAAFWFGMPLTWITLVVVREGVPMGSDEERLDFGRELDELRSAIDEDRARREAAPDSDVTAQLPAGTEGTDSGGADPEGGTGHDELPRRSDG